MTAFRLRHQATAIGFHEQIFDGIAARDAAAACRGVTALADYLGEKYEEAQAWRAKRDKAGGARARR